MSRACTYHCRACGSHFTSLRAFDAHRSDMIMLTMTHETAFAHVWDRVTIP